jgi:hypothetical protein
MSAAARSLLILGGLLEFAGIVAVAWPDLIPYRDRLNRWLGIAFRRSGNRVRRWFRLPPLTTTVTIGAAGGASLAGRASARVSITDDASLERKVEFLLKRDQETQDIENRFARRLNSLEDRVPREL